MHNGRYSPNELTTGMVFYLADEYLYPCLVVDNENNVVVYREWNERFRRWEDEWKKRTYKGHELIRVLTGRTLLFYSSKA